MTEKIDLTTPAYSYPGGIEVFEGVWKDPNATIKLVEDDCDNPATPTEWLRADVQGQGGYEGYQDIRTNLHLGITNYAERGTRPMQVLHNNVADLFEPATQSYMFRHNIADTPHEHEFYMMMKYSGGQHFGAHTDGLPGSKRFLSCVLYLNDDYEGGELEFVNYGVTIKPKKATLVLFPSYYTHAHIAHPVTQGTKYSIVGWINHLK